MKPRISVLVSARKDSKYLAKFLFGYFEKTDDIYNTEILVMMNKNDTWNKELVDYFSGTENIEFHYEDYQYGRDGLHVYFNDLLIHATGDWVVYFCEDHFITFDGWDSYVRQLINGGPRGVDSEEVGKTLDPTVPYCLVPKFDNAGAMNHILSLGYIQALGGVLGRHGWIDSYINGVNQGLGTKFERENVIRFDDEMFHDFTHDQPNPMSDSKPSKVKKKFPLFSSEIVLNQMRQDSESIRERL